MCWKTAWAPPKRWSSRRNTRRFATLLLEDQAVLVRGTALPEESAATKISVQDIVPLDLARVPQPSLIAIKVWLNRNGVSDKAAALQELFTASRGTRRCGSA